MTQKFKNSSTDSYSTSAIEEVKYRQLDQHREHHEKEYQEHLLEQYKILADSLNGLRAVKEQTNRSHTATISIVVVAASLLTRDKMFTEVPAVILSLLPLLGLSLCVIWFFNIRSFGLTMASRYRVLHEMEERLPYPCFRKALEYMGEQEKVRRLTKSEQFLPVVFAVVFFAILVYVVAMAMS